MNTDQNTNQTEQINHLVKRFVAHQGLIGLKDGPFARRYLEYVGSEKTWMLLKNGKWQGHVAPERILEKLKRFADRLDGAAAFDQASFNHKQPFVTAMESRFETLMGSPRDRRCLIALAPEGVGKSWWASWKLDMAQQDGQIRFYVRLNHTWREKSLHIARAMAEKVGAAPAKSPAGQVKSLIEMMRSLGEGLFILDEGHNGGVALFKLLKDLIDETPWRFVYLAFPTEFDNVRSSSTGAMAEARQLFRRSVKPIFDDYRDGVRPEDITAFLASRGFNNNRQLADFSDNIAPLLARNQNLSALDDALDDARVECDEMGRSLTLEMLREAVKAMCTTASERRAAQENLRRFPVANNNGNGTSRRGLEVA